MITHPTTHCAASKDCKAKAKVEKMDSATDSPKWQTFTANAHTCQLPVALDGDVAPAAKRARTVAPRDSAPGDAAQSDYPAGGDDGNSALSQLRARHRNLIRGAIKSRSILLVSYNGKAPSMMRPTSWANEPFTFWTRYIGDNSKESETTYSLSVAKINDITSFD